MQLEGTLLFISFKRHVPETSSAKMNANTGILRVKQLFKSEQEQRYESSRALKMNLTSQYN